MENNRSSSNDTSLSSSNSWSPSLSWSTSASPGDDGLDLDYEYMTSNLNLTPEEFAIFTGQKNKKPKKIKKTKADVRELNKQLTK